MNPMWNTLEFLKHVAEGKELGDDNTLLELLTAALNYDGYCDAQTTMPWETPTSTSIGSQHFLRGLAEVEKVTEGPEFIKNITFVVVCIVCAGLASGLTQGLLSLDYMEMKIKSRSGTELEKRYASKVLPIISNHHLLLVTLMLWNASATEALPIFLNKLVPEYIAIIISVTAVLFMGEIIPASILTGPRQLEIAATLTPLVYLVLFIFAPIAYPISVVLDHCLGHDTGMTVYNRREMATMVALQQEEGSRFTTARERGSTVLDRDDVMVLGGALKFREMEVLEVMTPVQEVYMVPSYESLSYKTMYEIFKMGFSRIPVFERDRNDIVGLILAKDLIFMDPEDDTPIRNFINLFGRKPAVAWPDQTLGEVLRMFCDERAHMAIVRDVDNSGAGDPVYKVVGIITLEDIIEVILGTDILDETDQMEDAKMRSPMDGDSSGSSTHSNSYQNNNSLQGRGKFKFGAGGDGEGQRMAGNVWEGSRLGAGGGPESFRDMDFARLRLLHSKMSNDRLSSDELNAVTAHLMANVPQVQVLCNHDYNTVRRLVMNCKVLNMRKKGVSSSSALSASSSAVAAVAAGSGSGQYGSGTSRSMNNMSNKNVSSNSGQQGDVSPTGWISPPRSVNTGGGGGDGLNSSSLASLGGSGIGGTGAGAAGGAVTGRSLMGHGGQMLNFANEDMIYRRGKMSSTCTLILQGRVGVLAGKDEFYSEMGAWSTLAGDALLQEEGTYLPDFSAFVTSDSLRFLQITVGALSHVTAAAPPYVAEPVIPAHNADLLDFSSSHSAPAFTASARAPLLSPELRDVAVGVGSAAAGVGSYRWDETQAMLRKEREEAAAIGAPPSSGFGVGGGGGGKGAFGAASRGATPVSAAIPERKGARNISRSFDDSQLDIATSSKLQSSAARKRLNTENFRAIRASKAAEGGGSAMLLGGPSSKYVKSGSMSGTSSSGSNKATAGSGSKSSGGGGGSRPYAHSAGADTDSTRNPLYMSNPISNDSALAPHASPNNESPRYYQASAAAAEANVPQRKISSEDNGFGMRAPLSAAPLPAPPSALVGAASGAYLGGEGRNRGKLTTDSFNDDDDNNDTRSNHDETETPRNAKSPLLKRGSGTGDRI